MFSYLSGDMGDNNMPVLQFNFKLGIGQSLKDRPFHFNVFFFSQAYPTNV